MKRRRHAKVKQIMLKKRGKLETQRFMQDEGDTFSSNDTSVDRISMLPDELLGSILSRITLKEQIATSILSSRWRYLWTLTNKLDFDAIDSLVPINMRWEYEPTDNVILSAYENVKLDFFTRVNHVLASRREGSPIEDFKLYFDLGKQDERYINEWLRYALAGKVQRLELNLNTTLVLSVKDRYVFPETFFSHVHLKQLKSISLNYVGVDSKALEFFLHNLPLLEDLSVSESINLSSLRVAGPFPSLKHLEINRCYELNSLEICDSNLVCVKYVGRAICFLLRNLPLLAHVALPKSLIEYMKANVAQYSSIFQQLEIVNVDLEFHMSSFVLPVEMSNLKQLEVVVRPNLVKEDESLLWLADLIQSAPHLQKLVILSGRYRASAELWGRELQKFVNMNLYPQLKEVEFLGFCGMPSDLEFIYHIVENAAALKKIIVDAKSTAEKLWIRKFFFNRDDDDMVGLNQLKEKLALEKPGIKLEFLNTPS